MKPTPKQQAILDHFKTNKLLTSKQAHGLIGNHYRNASHHVSMCLSRMVKNGMLKRISRGKFEKGRGKAGVVYNENQATLF